MKYINKLNAPEDYIIWCNTQKELGSNYDYKSLPNPQKKHLHEALLLEQGYICGYTMKRVDLNISHIEHIKPQHICKHEDPGIDLDYNNLISCFPKDGMKSNCRYGAQAKDKWWENNGADFLSPLHDVCELRVIYNMQGEIEPTNFHKSETETTIFVLKLDDPILTQDRKMSIHEFIYGADGANPLSPDDTKIAIDRIYQPNSDGLLREFCIAIHDALYEYADTFQ